MVMTNFRTTSSVSYMITDRQLNSPLLQKRRAQARAFMIYRVVFQLIDIPSTSGYQSFREEPCAVCQNYWISEIRTF